MRTPHQLAMLRASIVCLIGVIFLAAVLLSSGCALKVGVGVAAAADFHSTQLAIANGAHEGNPIVGDGAVRQAVVKAIGIGGVLALTQLVENKGYPTLARMVQALAIVAQSSAAVWNYRLARQ